MAIYIVRKYVKANSISEALKKEKSTAVHDCWLSDASTTRLMDETEKDEKK